MNVELRCGMSKATEVNHSYVLELDTAMLKKISEENIDDTHTFENTT